MYARLISCAGLIGALLCLVPSLVRAELAATVEANRDSIYLGESLVLTIKVSGSEASSAPDLSAISGCSTRLLGSMSSSSFSFSFGSGGQRQLKQHIGRDFTFQLTPTQAGKFTAGPIVVRDGTEMVTIAGPAIQVRGVEPQDWVLLTVTSSRDSVLVDEPFEIECAVSIRQLGDRYGEHDPLNPQDPPWLGVPFLSGPPADGLAGPDLKAYLNGLIVSAPDQPSFKLNDYNFRPDPFQGMLNFNFTMEPQPWRFMFPRRTVTGPRGTYHVYSMRLIYVGKQEGNFTFGPVEFRGQPIVDVGTGGQIISQPVFAVGAACTVRVVPPPETGRPPSFVGAIGSNLTVTAKLDAQTCNVGDPLTLTLDLSGDISLENLTPPRLSLQPELTRQFRVYDDTVQTLSRAGGKTYQYTIRPTQSGTFELPPLAVAYYDVRERAYKTVHTEPIPLRANEATALDSAMILSATTNRSAQSVVLTSAGELPLPPITMQPVGAESEAVFKTRVHGTLFAAGPLVFGCAAVGRGLFRLAQRRTQGARRRRAWRKAEAMLVAATRSADSRTRTTAIRAALGGYLADRFGAAMQGMTPSVAQQIFDRAPQISEELRQRYARMYLTVFNAEFTPGSAAGTGPDAPTVDDARTLIRALENSFHSESRRAPRGSAAPLLAIACMGIAWTTYAADDASARFAWEQANAALASAHTPEEYTGAANLYRALIVARVHNGPVFYNYGVALEKAGHHADATRAFLRAERYLGTTEDIRQGLLVAQSGGKSSSRATLPWSHLLLFWHYGLDMSLRWALAAGSFSLIWLAGTLRLWNLRKLARRLQGAAIAGLILFGSSVTASLHAEARDQSRTAMREIQSPSPAVPEQIP